MTMAHSGLLIVQELAGTISGWVLARQGGKMPKASFCRTFFAKRWKTWGHSFSSNAPVKRLYFFHARNGRDLHREKEENLGVKSELIFKTRRGGGTAKPEQ
jgi:hypothetical protein